MSRGTGERAVLEIEGYAAKYICGEKWSSLERKLDFPQVTMSSHVL
jgi:hypothetical protein